MIDGITSLTDKFRQIKEVEIPVTIEAIAALEEPFFNIIEAIKGVRIAGAHNEYISNSPDRIDGI